MCRGVGRAPNSHPIFVSTFWAASEGGASSSGERSRSTPATSASRAVRLTSGHPSKCGSGHSGSSGLRACGPSGPWHYWSGSGGSSSHRHPDLVGGASGCARSALSWRGASGSDASATRTWLANTNQPRRLTRTPRSYRCREICSNYTSHREWVHWCRSRRHGSSRRYGGSQRSCGRYFGG